MTSVALIVPEWLHTGDPKGSSECVCSGQRASWSQGTVTSQILPLLSGTDLPAPQGFMEMNWIPHSAEIELARREPAVSKLGFLLHPKCFVLLLLSSLFLLLDMRRVSSQDAQFGVFRG